MPGQNSLTRDDLKKLAKQRVKEAEELYRKHLYDGCIYLCGYVVECALKARICRYLKIREYPTGGKYGRIFKTHDFELLKLLGGLEGEITITKNKSLFENWSAATKWQPEERYRKSGTYTMNQASEVLASLRDRPNGVLVWLAKKW